jgi:hypothetical protein
LSLSSRFPQSALIKKKSKPAITRQSKQKAWVPSREAARFEWSLSAHNNRRSSSEMLKTLIDARAFFLAAANELHAHMNERRRISQRPSAYYLIARPAVQLCKCKSAFKNSGAFTLLYEFFPNRARGVRAHHQSNS